MTWPHQKQGVELLKTYSVMAERGLQMDKNKG